jgi:signal transduction histidine kinase/GAF domain-containing protein
MHSSQTSAQYITAQRLAALSRVGAALMSERDETRLFQLIVETARDLIGATFAALTLRPVNAEGEPLVPSEGHLFQLAAIVGVPPEQEAQLRRMPLGGEGLLLPIFHHGVPVRVADAVALMARTEASPMTDARAAASQAAAAYVHGQLPAERLHAQGVPPGHPIVHSFLGAPVLNRSGEVRGGLLLGHSQPGQFTHEDEILLAGLAAQAAVAIENVRWYQTAQMRAQELDATFESIADGVTLVDPQGNVRRENGAARQLRERLQETPAGERAVEALLATPARRVIEGAASQESTVRVDEMGGETREYLVTASPLCLPTPPAGLLPQNQERMGQGSLAGAVVVWRDVTEARRRLVEQRAHIETEARRALLQHILDELPSSVYLVRGREARLVLANRAATTLFGATWLPGQSMREFLEEHRIRLLGADGRPLPLEQFATLRAVQRGETVLQHQETIYHPDGTALPILVNAVALDARNLSLLPADAAARAADEAEPVALVVHQDVTAIEARRALLQCILDELPSSVYLVRGQDARLVLANRAAAAVWGAPWPPGQPMGAFLEEHHIRVSGTDGHLLALEQLATLRAVQHGETVRQQQVSIHHPDGTALPVLVNAVALATHQFDVAPAPPGTHAPERAEPAAIVVHQDVTALKAAEQLKDEFISIAAHELRTPLAILSGFVQTLLNQTARGKGPPLAEWQQQSLQGIDLATARLVDLAEDLLDVTRVQAGRLELQREPTDLVALARRVMARRQLTTKRHTLTLLTVLAHLVVHADPRRIEQVLSNLIGNAIKYSPEGGAIEVTLRADNETGEALLSVRDRGIGIPMHEQAQVFGRFARAGNAQAYGIRGAGLGLYLCRELVEAHGGRIWLESAEGQGSTFFVALPLRPQAASTPL